VGGDQGKVAVPGRSEEPVTAKILGVVAIIAMALLALTCGGSSPTNPQTEQLVGAAQGGQSSDSGQPQGETQGETQLDPEEFPPCPTPGNADKVIVCHIPPGNPANAHDICIDPNAVPAHLGHGDYGGECIPCDPGDPYCCPPGDPYCCPPGDPYCNGNKGRN